MEYNKNASFTVDFATSLGGLVSGIAQANAMKAQGDYAMKIGEMNARFAEMEAKEVIEAGDKEASEHGKQINQMVGAQKAAFAGGNIKVDSGTALAVRKQTMEIGYAEQRTIRNNAWRKAFGLQTDAFNSRQSGIAGRNRANQQATSTLLTGVSSFAKGVGTSYRDNYGPGSTDKKVETKKTEVSKIYDPATYQTQRMTERIA